MTIALPAGVIVRLCRVTCSSMGTSSHSFASSVTGKGTATTAVGEGEGEGERPFALELLLDGSTDFTGPTSGLVASMRMEGGSGLGGWK